MTYFNYRLGLQDPLSLKTDLSLKLVKKCMTSFVSNLDFFLVLFTGVLRM